MLEQLLSQNTIYSQRKYILISAIMVDPVEGFLEILGNFTSVKMTRMEDTFQTAGQPVPGPRS